MRCYRFFGTVSCSAVQKRGRSDAYRKRKHVSIEPVVAIGVHGTQAKERSKKTVLIESEPKKPSVTLGAEQSLAVVACGGVPAERTTVLLSRLSFTPVVSISPTIESYLLRLALRGASTCFPWK